MRTVLLSLILLFLPFAARCAYLVDDFEDGNNLTAGGGAWQTYDDGYSSITFTASNTPGYNGSNRCAKADSILIAGGSDQYAGVFCYLNAGGTAVDLSVYKGVRMRARGSGSLEFQVTIDATRTTYNHFTKGITLSSSWQLYEVPFADLQQTWGTPVTWDASAVYGIQFNRYGAPGVSTSAEIDDLEFYTAAEEITAPYTVYMGTMPKVDQIGYLQGADKYFTVLTQTASAGNTYYIKNASNSVTAHSGIISAAVIDDTQEAGEAGFRTDFSAFDTPGTYYIEVNSNTSFAFSIAPDIYDALFADSLRAFYLIRCGTAVNDSVTGLNHAACHLPDAVLDITGAARDLTGGWHNAGDFGKWTHEHAFSLGYMMWLQELKSAYMPATLKNEIRWGLDFLLKMQNPDGSVYHKVDTQPDFCFGTAPENDPYTREARFGTDGETQPSTIDAAVFCASMIQGYRIFSATDSVYAARLSTCAKAAWDWLEANPKRGQNDIYYTDGDYSQEYMWAKAEMYRLTGSSAYLNSFETDLDAKAFINPNWTDTQFFAYLAVYNSGAPDSVKTKVRNKAVAYADSCVALQSASAYGVALSSTEYYWGSVSGIMGKANCMLLAYLMTGSVSYTNAALKELDYMLGLNPLDQVYVTGFGSKKNTDPYHWAFETYGIAIPGWVTGGPNGQPVGADPMLLDLINKNTPPAKCWVNASSPSGSWASNEGTTDQNAHLVYLSGFFKGGIPAAYTATATQTPAVTFTPTYTQTALPVATFTPTPQPTAALQLPQGRVYPQPAGPGKKIFFMAKAGEEKSFRLYSAGFRLILEERFKKETELCGVKIPDIANGIYYYTVETGGIKTPVLPFVVMDSR